MKSTRVATWVKINLGDATASGSDTILNFALGNIEIKYDGDTYSAKGEMTSVGDVDQRLSFRKTSLTIKLNSTNLINLGLVNQYKYRNKELKVWFAARNEDGTINTSTIQQIFGGQLDSHDVSRKHITLKAYANFGRFEQIRGARTSHAAQKDLITSGAYGANTTLVDNGFIYADRDLGDLTLGIVPSKTITTYTEQVSGRRYWLFGPRTRTRIPNTTYIEGKDGGSLSDDGSDYTRPLIYGRGDIPGNPIYGLNPTQALINSVYPALNHNGFITDTTPATKYISTVYALGEGPLHDVTVTWSELASGAVADTAGLGHNAIGTVKNSAGQVIAIVEIKLGTYTQSACSNLVALAPELDSTFRCIGTGYAVVTAIASDAFGKSYPEVSFQVGGKELTSVVET